MSSVTVDELFYNAYAGAGMLEFEGTGLSEDQTEEARKVHNGMVDMWRADGSTVYHIRRQEFPILPSRGDYTLGPGGDFDTPRQERLERAGIVLTSESPEPEYPLYPMTVDEYQHWTLKGQATNWPRVFWYEKSNPLAIVHLLYIPTDANAIALYLEEFLLPISATGDQLLEFPAAYQAAIESNMAVILAGRYPKRSNLSQDTRTLSRSSLDLIKNANNRPLSRISDFSSATTGRSNIFSGNRYRSG